MAKFGSKGAGNKRSGFTMSDAEAMAMVDKAHRDDGALNGGVKGTVKILDIPESNKLPRE